MPSTATSSIPAPRIPNGGKASAALSRSIRCAPTATNLRGGGVQESSTPLQLTSCNSSQNPTSRARRSSQKHTQGRKAMADESDTRSGATSPQPQPQQQTRPKPTNPRPASQPLDGNRTRPRNSVGSVDHEKTSSTAPRKNSKSQDLGKLQEKNQKAHPGVSIPALRQKPRPRESEKLKSRPPSPATAGPPEEPNPHVFRIRGFPKDVDADIVLKYLQSLHSSVEDNASVTLSEAFDDQKVAIASFKVRPQSLLDSQARKSTWRLHPDPALGLPQQLLVDSHFHGLTPLCTVTPAPELDKTVDIIAVAGPGEHAYETWRSDAWGDMWLQDFLPRSGIENIRVYTYGCDGSANSADSWDHVEHNAQMLREEILRCRKSDPLATTRPLIFICYSLGGVLVLETLTRDIHRTRFEKVANCCTGLLMFGVPLQGTTPEGGASETGDASPTDSHTEYLDRLVEKFKTTYLDKDVKVISFYELEGAAGATKANPKNGASPKAAINGSNVSVKRDSATWLSPQDDNDCCVGLKADHRSLVKFDDEYDQAFAVVKDRLERCVELSRRRMVEVKPETQENGDAN